MDRSKIEKSFYNMLDQGLSVGELSSMLIDTAKKYNAEKNAVKQARTDLEESLRYYIETLIGEDLTKEDSDAILQTLLKIEKDVENLRRRKAPTPELWKELADLIK